MDSEYYRKHWASPERIRRMADPKRFDEVAPHYPAVHPLHMEPLTIPVDDTIAGLVCFLNLYHEISDPPELGFQMCRMSADFGTIIWLLESKSCRKKAETET